MLNGRWSEWFVVDSTRDSRAKVTLVSEVWANQNKRAFRPLESQADHPLLVGAVVDSNLSNDLLLFIEEIEYRSVTS